MLVPRLVAHNVPFMPLLILLPFEYFMSVRNKRSWKFPGSPVVRALYFTAGGMGLIPGWGTKIPHAAEHGQKKKKKIEKKKEIRGFNHKAYHIVSETIMSILLSLN